MSRSASVSVSGVSRAAWSPRTSVATPPSPNTTSGPNMWSSATPTMTSMPPAIIGWTRTWRCRCAEPVRQGAVGVPDIGLGAQVELDRARVGLVQEPGHVGLEHHRARRRLEAPTASSSLRAGVSSTSGMP